MGISIEEEETLEGSKGEWGRQTGKAALSTWQLAKAKKGAE
jgi:hypothetical protein